MSIRRRSSSGEGSLRARLALAAALGLGGCSLHTADVDTTPEVDCAAGLLPAHMVELYFGRSISGGGEVSEDDWREFLDEVATPAFPDGLTALDAEGRYLERSTGSAILERSKVLIIVVTDLLGLEERVGRVIERYKKRFDQESVLRIDRDACVAF